MKIAKVVSEMSKDPSTQVGTVIVKDKIIYGTGYNGFPKGDPDYLEEYEDRPTKLSKIIHAEENAIKNAVYIPERFTVYVYPFMPCISCFELLKKHCVSKIVTYKQPDSKRSKWEIDWENVRIECKQLNITIVEL
jgi:dCMP deaminase